MLFLHSHFSRRLLAFSAQIQPFSGKYRCLYPDFRGHGRTRCGSLAWNSCMITDDMAGVLDVLAFCVNVCLDTAAVHMRDAIWRRSTLKR